MTTTQLLKTMKPTRDCKLATTQKKNKYYKSSKKLNRMLRICPKDNDTHRKCKTTKSQRKNNKD